MMWLADLCIALGSAAGIITKLIALADSSTSWTRRASLPNIVFYPPSLWAFYFVGLYATFVLTSTSFLIWCGIYVWRSPDEEDWLGRK